MSNFGKNPDAFEYFITISLCSFYVKLAYGITSKEVVTN